MARLRWIFLLSVSLSNGARPSEEADAKSAQIRGASVIASGHFLLRNASSPEKGRSWMPDHRLSQQASRLDDFIGSIHAAETNAQMPATHFKGFENYYTAQNGLKDASKPLLQHAQDLGHRAVGTYDSMKQLSGVIKKTQPVLNAIDQKADETRLQVNQESHDVVDRSLNALGALRKYEANRGSIDDYFDAGKLSEKTLLREGMRHAVSGKLDLFATDGFPSRYPQVKLDDLDTPREHHGSDKLIAHAPANQNLKDDDLVGHGSAQEEDKAIQKHRRLSQTLDGHESIVGDVSDASKVERELLPGEK